MNRGGKKKTNNRLWLTRKRRGLRQKQVAHLLNQRTVEQLSRYENGTRIPTLGVALKLEMILGVPLRILFGELYEQLSADVRTRAESSRSLKDTVDQVVSGDACPYGELLASPTRTGLDTDKVRKHVTDLAKRIAYL